jgi:hypothetical protein
MEVKKATIDFRGVVSRVLSDGSKCENVINGLMFKLESYMPSSSKVSWKDYMEECSVEL